MSGKYQVIPPLGEEQYASLEADIVARGVQVAVELDEAGNVLDGHYRKQIADAHGLPYPTITRSFGNEEEKLNHAFKLNLCRRNWLPWQWGIAFRAYLDSRGVPRGKGKGDPHAKDHKTATLAVLAKDIGVSDSTAEKRLRQADKFAALPPDAQRRVELHPESLAKEIREHKRTAERERLNELVAAEIESPTGLYDVIVIDPPWPMRKIERDERPNQAEMPYPTMTEEELAALTIPAADRCHVWLWTTHRFLPVAFRLLDAWEFKYVCTFVWHKPGGFQPVGLPQYNCEFALYARRGSPQLLDTADLPTCFSAPRGEHSAKPEQFYELLRRITAGRRLDMFNRRPIEGFSTWGKESAV